MITLSICCSLVCNDEAHHLARLTSMKIRCFLYTFSIAAIKRDTSEDARMWFNSCAGLNGPVDPGPISDYSAQKSSRTDFVVTNQLLRLLSQSYH